MIEGHRKRILGSIGVAGVGALLLLFLPRVWKGGGLVLAPGTAGSSTVSTRSPRWQLRFEPWYAVDSRQMRPAFATLRRPDGSTQPIDGWGSGQPNSTAFFDALQSAVSRIPSGASLIVEDFVAPTGERPGTVNLKNRIDQIVRPWFTRVDWVLTPQLPA